MLEQLKALAESWRGCGPNAFLSISADHVIALKESKLKTEPVNGGLFKVSGADFVKAVDALAAIPVK